MHTPVSRRSVLCVTGALLVTPLNGCLDALHVQQAYGDLLISNTDDQAHEVRVTSVNQTVRVFEDEEAATKHFDRTIEERSTIREEEFFVGGDSDVTVAVDGSIVRETRVEIWRGEGGDDDRHEERLTVTINPDGDAEVTVDVTHTPT